MKRCSIVVFTGLFVILALITGCVGKDASILENEDSPITTTILSGGTTDKWFMLSNGFSEALNRTYPGSILHVGPGTVIANILGVNEGEAEFGLCHTSLAYEAYNGMGQFDEPKDNIAAVALLYSSPAQMIVRKDLGITRFSEIIENKIPIRFNAGRLGDSMETAFIKILEFYGITYEDMIDWGCTIYKKGFEDTSNMFADEAIDGFFIVAGAPTVFPTQLSVNTEMVMLEWDQSLLDEMYEKYGYAYCTIPKDTYTFMDKDVSSFNSYNMLCTNTAVSEETVYKLTKAIYENLDYIQSLHASFVEITPERIAGDASIPYHPGAEKYYREAGIID